ncbi:MAG: LamG-like jellyroll fold domain-containing protein [Candidatus Paceibacterota bacterium]|jgi:type II secretory pathway pseudopilin PulG
MHPATVLKKSIVFFSRTEGQLLVEMLVALVIGGLLTLTASIALVSLVRYNFENQGGQNAGALAYNLMTAAAAFSENNWHNIYDLNKTSGSHYYLVSAPTSSLAVAGDESVFFNDIEAGLIGYWKFDEATGTIAYDSSGSGNSGTFYGSPTRIASTTCEAGSCLSFDGVGQRVNLGSVQTGTSTTVSAWIKTTTSFQRPVFSNRGSGLYFGVSSGRFFIYDNTATPSPGMSSAIAVNDNNWHHIAWTSNGSVSLMYVDGVLNVTQNQSRASDTGVAYIAYDAPNNEYFPGSVDDVRVYNRALSASEISSLYNNSPYARYFYVDNVLRDGSGNIATSSGTDDPSTQMIHAAVLWKEGRTTTLGQYVTRSKETALFQNNWQGGSGKIGPITTILSGYDTSTNIIAGATLTTPSSTGSLMSSIFDTQVVGGAAINSLLWQGSLNGGAVRFQFAYANSTSEPWVFLGTGGSPFRFYTPLNSGVPLAITDINNFRYFRYTIFLDSSTTSTPTVSSVSLGWSW